MKLLVKLALLLCSSLAYANDSSSEACSVDADRDTNAAGLTSGPTKTDPHSSCPWGSPTAVTLDDRGKTLSRIDSLLREVRPTGTSGSKGISE